MITDNQTNTLYLADSLPIKFPAFFETITNLLEECKVDFSLLPDTKDIWAVDFMPIQVSLNRFIQFAYNPDYLRNSSKWRKTISDVDKICDTLGLEREHSKIILDGGNVIKSGNSVIMCDKIFKENKDFKRNRLIDELQELFEVEKIIFIPQDPEDFTGHADGMVRFINYKTVLVNSYHPNYYPQFQKELRNSLEEAGLELVGLVYRPDETSSDSAVGLYMNYLEIGNLIIVPTFGITDTSNRWQLNQECADDETAVIMLEAVFENHAIRVLDCNEIAKEGGVLNCISWKVKK
jgi:agmatine deiminase